MKFDGFGCTHIGRRRRNEDFLCVAPALGLYAVADGVGGYAGGDIASRLAIAALEEFLESNLRDDDITWPYSLTRGLTLDENLVLVATRVAHDRIVSRRHGELEHMGSTLALVVVRDDHAIVGHIGDSRVYRLRGRALEQLTRDHSLYEELVAQGVSLPARAEFVHANVVTRALGMSGLADVVTWPLAAGDRLLLCTDGLSGALDDDEIAALLAASPAEQACRHLVDAAFDAGASDNITAIVVAPAAPAAVRSGRAA